MRFATVTQKVPKEETGLVTALYVHVHFNDRGEAIGCDASTYGKMQNTQLEKAIAGVCKAVNDILDPDTD